MNEVSLSVVFKDVHGFAHVLSACCTVVQLSFIIHFQLVAACFSRLGASEQ